MREQESVLEGQLSVQAALETGSRPIYQLLLDERKRYDRRLKRIVELAAAAGIEIAAMPRDEINRIAAGDSHGGLLARAGARRFSTLSDLMPSDRTPFIVMLDGIEDPYNFAGAIRAIYAAGADGLVLRPRNWTSASALVGRASAGASERLPIVIAANASEAAAACRARGLSIAATAKSSQAQDIYSAGLAQPLFLLIGGERRGVTRSFLDSADMLLRIPYGRDFGPALGAVGATAVIAFEVMRQRRHHPA